MQIWAEPRRSALPICNYSQILYQFLTFTQNLKRSLCERIYLLLRFFSQTFYFDCYTLIFLLYSDLFADISKTASVAIRFRSRSTYLSSMINKTVAKVTSFFWRDNLPQSHLHLLRLFNSIYQTDPVCQADTMCICHNCRLSEYITHNKVGTFSSNSRKL